MAEWNIVKLQRALESQIKINKKLCEETAAINSLLQEILKASPELNKKLDHYLENNAKRIIINDLSHIESEILVQEEQLKKIV